MKSINWGGGAVAALAASVAASDSPDESTLTESEKYLKAEIARVKSEGCGAARWGRVFCALGGVGPIMFPGLFEYVIDVCKSTWLHNPPFPPFFLLL